jgi:hypothetical protein
MANPRRHFIVRCLTSLSAVASFGNATRALADKLARPPNPKELVGAWIGFDNDELEFTRLDLRSDFTGYCARLGPADTELHGLGVAVYRVTKWDIDDWDFRISLTPLSTDAEPIELRGKYNGFSLHLELSGTNGKWNRSLVLNRESRENASNIEARDKIRQLERR